MKVHYEKSSRYTDLELHVTSRQKPNAAGSIWYGIVTNKSGSQSWRVTGRKTFDSREQLLEVYLPLMMSLRWPDDQ